MSSPKQMMDFKPVKSIAANVSNEQHRNWSDELFERKAKNPDHNYDRSRTALNFQVGPGGVITAVRQIASYRRQGRGDNQKSISGRMLDGDRHIQPRSHGRIRRNRERMREMAFRFLRS